MAPPPCLRMCGRTARVSAAGAKKCRSNSARSSSSVVSSTAPTWVRPALLTSTSMRPNSSSAFATAASRCVASVTSSGTAKTRSPGPRSASESVLRAAATTESPRSRTASAMARPKPLEAPVMNQMRTERKLPTGLRRLGEPLVHALEETAPARPGGLVLLRAHVPALLQEHLGPPVAEVAQHHRDELPAILLGLVRDFEDEPLRLFDLEVLAPPVDAAPAGRREHRQLEGPARAHVHRNARQRHLALRPAVPV